jgi:hypothetical protein
MYTDNYGNSTNDIQRARDFGKRDQELLNDKIECLADDFMETDSAMSELMYENGDAEVSDGILKAMLNAYRCGNVESVNVFAKSFCEEMKTRLYAKCEKEAEK